MITLLLLVIVGILLFGLLTWIAMDTANRVGKVSEGLSPTGRRRLLIAMLVLTLAAIAIPAVLLGLR